MRSRRVILRFLPLGLVTILLGSVMVWQDGVERRLGSDVNASPEVVVSEHDVPVVAAAEPSKAEKRAAPRAPSSAVRSTSLRTVAELAPIDIKSFSMVGVTCQRSAIAAAVSWQRRMGLVKTGREPSGCSRSATSRA